MMSEMFERIKKFLLKTRLCILLCILLMMVFWLLYHICNTPESDHAAGDSSYAVRHIVWDMGTEEERACDICYDPDSGKFFRVNAMGNATTRSVIATMPIDYSGSTKAVMEFAFTEHAREDALTADFGVTDIYHGTLKEAGSFYAELVEHGYGNCYTIATANAVDIYMQKQDGSSYRLMIVPEAGGMRCTVTFAEITDTIFAAVGEQLEKFR